MPRESSVPTPIRNQCTIARPIEADGAGVHSGRRVHLRLDPAPAGSGLVFVRADLPGMPSVAARPENVNRDALQRMTAIEGQIEDSADPGAQPAAAMMIEHLLSACAGLGVSNLRVTLDAPELPIFDGSAAVYSRLLIDAGIIGQDSPAARINITRPVILQRAGAEMIAIPALRPRYTYFAEFTHAGMCDQQVTFDLDTDDYFAAIAPARTFCFWEDVEKLRAAGLIQGGSLDCAIVLRDGAPINGDYRMENELARHKLLDLIGDLAILGAPVNAMISARCSGHAMHQEFARLLAEACEPH